MSTTNDNCPDPLEQAMQQPRRASNESGSAETHSIPDLIAAADYIESRKACNSGSSGIRFTKLIPPGNDS